MSEEKSGTGPRWDAQLNVSLDDRSGETLVTKVSHQGPLRIQKPFYQSDGSCHVYLLHPPGGMAGGDRLSIRIESEGSAQTLLTTPSAGKFYRCIDGLKQQQRVHIHAAGDSRIEWVPQENIFFCGANAELELEICLERDSTFLGWDIQCLGRHASGESFSNGHVIQRVRLFRSEKLIHRERIELIPASPMMRAGWGFGDNHIFGTLIASLPEHMAKQLRKEIISVVEELSGNYTAQFWGFSFKESLILGRYLGESAEECREGFNEMRLKLGLANIIEAGETPRIWNT